MNCRWMGATEIKQVLHLVLPFHSICIGYCSNIRLFVVTPRFNVVSPRQTAIYVMYPTAHVPYGSRYMKSVYYHALRTVSESCYVIFGD